MELPPPIRELLVGLCAGLAGEADPLVVTAMIFALVLLALLALAGPGGRQVVLPAPLVVSLAIWRPIGRVPQIKVVPIPTRW
jgi:hypothetical protein